MSGYKRQPRASDDFDYFAKVDDQVVHCQRAAFIATGGIPLGDSARLWLGMVLGFGVVIGGTCAVGLLSLIGKLLKAVFA